MKTFDNFVIYSGRSGKEFLKNVITSMMEAEYPLPEQITIEAEDFNNGEIFIKLGDNVRKKEAHIFQTTYDTITDDLIEGIINSNLSAEHKKILMKRTLPMNKDIMELLVLGDATRRANARSASVYLPSMPYQRQDKKDEGRVPISARLMFDLVQASFNESMLERIVTSDLHADQAQGFINKPVDNVRASSLFALYIKSYFHLDNVVIVSPDAGGAKRARYVAKLLDLPYAIVDKRRTGHGEAEVSYVMGDVKDKIPIIVDDMIDTGGSIVGGARILRNHGSKEECYACCIHGIFSNKVNKTTGKIIFAEDILRDSGVKVITTNVIPRSEEYMEKHKDWLTILNLAPYFADAVYCNMQGEKFSERIMGYEHAVTDSMFNEKSIEKYIL